MAKKFNPQLISDFNLEKLTYENTCDDSKKVLRGDLQTFLALMSNIKHGKRYSNQVFAACALQLEFSVATLDEKLVSNCEYH